MCGITGYFGIELKTAQLDSAVKTLEKRGPNAGGTYFSNSKRVGLGHRRLSILDPTEGANQPLTTSCKRYTIVYNGEVYNFKKLKSTLISDGYHFHTDSDTEVILNLFKQKGNDAWNLLDGFFAIAIYDNEKNKIHLSRDRFGIKPLYYSFEDNVLKFGSELKAITALGIKKEIDKTALQYYFRLNYIPSPYSIFKSVKKMEPGNYISFDGNTFTQKKYFSLKQKESGTSKLSYSEAKKELHNLLENSVKSRLVSDVPLGTFLSGGIDSSVITALASKHNNSLDTFSVGFKDNKFFDETYYARLVAERYNTNHHEIYLSNNDLLDSLESLLEYTDEPFADSSALAVNALCKETMKKVTVALSGDGADELFGGYNKYQAEFRLQNQGIKERLVSLAHPLWNILPKSRNGKLTNTFRKLHKFSSGSRLTKQERYFDWCSIGKEELISKLLITTTELNEKEITSFIIPQKGLNDILLNDIHLVLPDDMLTKVDRMSMNNSLEVRVPFLDHKIVEFANSLPENHKINSQQKKRILQDTFRDILPEELYNRPKHGFEVPMLDWLKTDLNIKIRHVYLEESFIREQGLFNFKTVQGLLQQLHSANPEDSHATVWALVVFQHWYKKHFT